MAFLPILTWSFTWSVLNLFVLLRIFLVVKTVHAFVCHTSEAWFIVKALFYILMYHRSGFWFIVTVPFTKFTKLNKFLLRLTWYFSFFAFQTVRPQCRNRFNRDHKMSAKLDQYQKTPINFWFGQCMQMGNINSKLQVFRSFSHIFCNLLINWGFSNFSMKFALQSAKKKSTT